MEENVLNILEEGKNTYGKINSFKDLVVWRRSLEMTKAIYVMTKQLPESEKFGLVSQIRRASVSVSSNIAEGWGVSITGNYLHHLRIAYSSLCEVETQLIIIEELNLVAQSELIESKNLLSETSKMLKSLILSLETKTN